LNKEKLVWLKTFYENNRLKIIIITITTILFAFLTLDLLSTYLQPRKTEGCSPEQLVESFYTSINILDFSTMEDCVIEGAGKDLIQEVLRLSVIYKQAKTLGQQSNLILIKEWEAMGKIPLEPPQVLYGISGLHIVQEKENIYSVTYTKWEYYHNDKNELHTRNFEVKEKVFLKPYKKGWAIYKIDRSKV
jgi:hypothetical protein